MIKRILKNVLRIVLIILKTVSRKPCINIENKSKSSQFICTVIVVKRTTKFLSVVTPSYIYQ